jgi:ABC-type Na+ efflux pump permease subunit
MGITILIFGIFVGKIVGLELFGVLQLSFISLISYEKLNINLMPLSQFKIFNGFQISLFT